jgi:hypothetical protein
MFGDVCEGLLDNPIKNNLNGRWQTVQHRAGQNDFQVVTLGNTFDQGLECRNKPEIVEHRRPKIVRYFPQLQLDQLEHVFDLLETCATGRWQLAGCLIQTDKDRREKLSRLVVDRVRDPLRLGLQHLIDPGQGETAVIARATYRWLSTNDSISQEIPPYTTAVDTIVNAPPMKALPGDLAVHPVLRTSEPTDHILLSVSIVAHSATSNYVLIGQKVTAAGQFGTAAKRLIPLVPSHSVDRFRQSRFLCSA